MRYYQTDWVQSTKSATRTTVIQKTGNTPAATITALLLPLLIIFLLTFVWSGSQDPKLATVLITTEGGDSGSGTIISPDGYIITNRHIVMPSDQAAREIIVHVHSGTSRKRSYPAQLIVPQGNVSPLSQDSSKLPEDYAVLKIQATGLPYAAIGDSLPQTLPLTSKVRALGYPSTGKVDAGSMGPTVDVAEGTVSRFLPDPTAPTSIIHDCKVVQGGEGGPLVDAKGRLVGIVTKTIDGQGQAAIPSRALLSVWKQYARTTFAY